MNQTQKKKKIKERLCLQVKINNSSNNVADKNIRNSHNINHNTSLNNINNEYSINKTETNEKWKRQEKADKNMLVMRSS